MAAPILMRQFKFYSKDQPMDFLTWASVSDAAKDKITAKEPLALEDRRSEDNIVVVDARGRRGPRGAL